MCTRHGFHSVRTNNILHQFIDNVTLFVFLVNVEDVGICLRHLAPFQVELCGIVIISHVIEMLHWCRCTCILVYLVNFHVIDKDGCVHRHNIKQRVTAAAIEHVFECLPLGCDFRQHCAAKNRPRRSHIVSFRSLK